MHSHIKARAQHIKACSAHQYTRISEHTHISKRVLSISKRVSPRTAQDIVVLFCILQAKY